MNLIAAKRKELGWRREDLASKSQVSITYIWRLETAGSTPGLDIARQIAAALGCEVDAVFPPSPLTPEPTAQTSAERS